MERLLKGGEGGKGRLEGYGRIRCRKEEEVEIERIWKMWRVFQ